jgi:hypothetical protein
MKTLLVAVLSVFSVSAFAQTITTQLETETPTVQVSKGVRVTAIKPVLEQRYSSFFPGEAGTVKRRLNPDDEAFGIAIGWADVPVRDLGWTTNLSYIDLGEQNNEEDRIDARGLARFDANLAYGFNSKFTGRIGANMTKFVQGDLGEELAAGLGGQSSLGFQISKNLGVEAGYTFMTVGVNNKGGRRTGTISGAEVALTGTF